MSTLVLIDGNAIMHRAFHAMPPLSTPKGEPINAVHGFVSMILKAVQDLRPTALAVAFDEKGKTFRQKELPTYQAQRPPVADELSSQFAKARDFLSAAKIPAYSMSGYEADDVIGTIANKFDGDVVIATGDRDILQLVNNKIKLYMPVAGVINAKLYSEADTIARMGVPPKLIPDYKGLVGDPSDNYFGVPGIGPKTAINLLNEFGNFHAIYKNLDKIPEKLREKLTNGKDSAFQSFKLATIITDVPVKFDFTEMAKWNLGSPEIVKLFADKFGFKTLTERIKKVGKEIEDSKQGALF
ncbi:MAG TPA: 5'-3' exonuclease H3TH domain-containing protein [Patescibacteria group bacterium]|nr:5'-3' exonuclease H3TH domain-containing protein [Patescibacteria group bacterium]